MLRLEDQPLLTQSLPKFQYKNMDKYGNVVTKMNVAPWNALQQCIEGRARLT